MRSTSAVRLMTFACLAAGVLIGPVLFPLAQSSALLAAPPSPAMSAPVGADRPASQAIALPGLAANADVSFDSYGVPTVEAASFRDALRVQGYLHARDRFAQMDLMRRYAAGEVAEVASALALSIDRQQRVMRLRARAHAAYAELDPESRADLDAYTAGVNAAVSAFEAPPPEYRFLKAPLTPWRSEDCFLIALSMAAMLNDSARIEADWDQVREALPQSVIDALRPRVSRWDVPILPDDPTDRERYQPSLPDPSVVDTRILRVDANAGRPEEGTRSIADAATFRLAPWCDVPSAESSYGDAPVIGSNGWAVAGSRTKDGRALLVNDMHLQITVPGIWYRMSLVYGGSKSNPRATPSTMHQNGEDQSELELRPPAAATLSDLDRLDGVTLPGAPGLISGSNGHVAWGFTNVEADFIDFVVIEPDPADETRYLVPGGSEPYGIEHEELNALGGAGETLDVRTTRWGPVVAKDHRGRPLALVWTALQPGGINLGLLAMRHARTVEDALDVARAWRGPQQNVLVADEHGRIGWMMAGYLPSRVGFDGTCPTSWADGSRRWNGERPEAQRPALIDPPDGVLVTANQRTVPLSVADSFGRMWASPERAFRIRERALAEAPLDETACTAIQLDILSLRFRWWRDVLLPALERGTQASNGASPSQSSVDSPTASTRPSPQQAERRKMCVALAKTFRDWNGEANVDAKAMGPIRGARQRLTESITQAIMEASVARAEPNLSPAERAQRTGGLLRGWVSDEAILAILAEQPDHLLPPSAASWDELIQDAAIAAAKEVRDRNGLQRWGKINESDFAHPLARSMPLLAGSFRIPPHEQPGHATTVRVSAPTFGASDRLVVSPGREIDGLLSIPTGQSGNPTSAHYKDLHESWRDGTYLPLRPTTIAERLTFVPVTLHTGPSSP
jgi:penicillin amidase